MKLSIYNINNKKPKDSFLTAISLVKRNFITYVICKCECGLVKEFIAFAVAKGHSKSCGCKKGEIITKKKTKYKNNIKEIYYAYCSMKRRCYVVSDKYYKNYGGIGVRVCDEWLNNYVSFLNWSKNNGWKKGLEIDKDIVGDGKLYSPTTCVWVTKKENNFRRKDTRMVLYNGEELSISEISRRSGLNYRTLVYRINSGWSNEKLFCIPNPKLTA